MNKQKLAEIVKAARLKRKMSYEDFANKFGTKIPGVYRLESGEQNICIETLCKVADTLDMDLEITFKKKK